MAGIKDLIEVFRGENVRLNPFRTRSSADMNPGGKIKVGKYATTAADEAINYASKKFPNVIKTTKITPKDFKIGTRVFNEVTSDFSDRPNIIKKIAHKVKNFTRDRSGQLGYNILSSKNKGKLEGDVLKTLMSNAKVKSLKIPQELYKQLGGNSLEVNIRDPKLLNAAKTNIMQTFLARAGSFTPLAMKGLTLLSSLPAATAMMFFQSTPANSDEANMKLEDFAKLNEGSTNIDKSLPTEIGDM